jgi:hypothetical protein
MAGKIVGDDFEKRALDPHKDAFVAFYSGETLEI